MDTYRLCSGGPTCTVCGTPYIPGDLQRCPSVPRRQVIYSSQQPKQHAAEPIVYGLGDYTEQLLAKIGVNKDRYAAAKAAVGLPPECGCAERQEQLNEWGRRVTAWWQGQ